MTRMKSILDVASTLQASGFELPESESLKNIDIVKKLNEIAYSPEVWSRNDDDPGLDELCLAFLDGLVEASGKRRFAEERALVVECANSILPLFNRALSEDDVDEIEEDRRYRGLPPRI